MELEKYQGIKIHLMEHSPLRHLAEAAGRNPIHLYYSSRIYVQYALRLGISDAEVVEDVERMVRQYPGSTARELAAQLGYENDRYVDKKLTKKVVNSVLYSFENQLFRRVLEGEESDYEINTAYWFISSPLT